MHRDVTLALVAAVGAAVSYGVGSVLQAIGAGRATRPNEDGEVHGLVVGLARQVPFIAGLALDVAGLGLSILALRSLPLFVVQAAVASSVAVTAVVAMAVLGSRLRASDWVAIGAVIVGLSLLAAAAGAENPVHTSTRFRVGLAAVGALLAFVGWFVARRDGLRSAQVLGAVAGLAYGVGAISIRVIVSFQPIDLLKDPATAAGVIGAVGGLLAFATALQRGSVTAATGALTAAETLLPAAVGLTMLHEHPRHGWWPVAAAGFVLAVGGAVLLSRFGEAAPTDTAP